MIVAEMFLQRAEQFHHFLVKRLPRLAQRICLPARLSGSALDGEHRFNLIWLVAVDRSLAAFVVK